MAVINPETGFCEYYKRGKGGWACELMPEGAPSPCIGTPTEPDNCIAAQYEPQPVRSFLLPAVVTGTVTDFLGQ